MAKQKQTTRYAFGNFRFYADCPHCKRRWDSDDLADMPEKCDRCGRSVVINDQARLFNGSKRELETKC